MKRTKTAGMERVAGLVPAGDGRDIARQGLYHWAIICGISAPFPSGFDSYSTSYQAATAFFAVIDLVAGVGLWLTAPWGAVVWLTSVISMAAVEVLFPQIYGGKFLVVLADLIMLGGYLGLVLMAAREQTEMSSVR